MITLTRNENNVLVSVGVDDLLENKLKVKFPRAFFSQKYRDKQWDGYFRFYSKKKHLFSIGLLEEVKRLLNKENIKYEIIDNRRKIKHNNFKCNIELRDYQERAFNLIKDEDIGIVGLPVNFGKSYLAMKLIEYKNVNTIWIVRTRTLAEQAYNDFKKFFNCEIGFIGSGVYKPAPITVALIQTLTNLPTLNEINSYFDCCIFDEVHGSRSLKFLCCAEKSVRKKSIPLYNELIFM